MERARQTMLTKDGRRIGERCSYCGVEDLTGNRGDLATHVANCPERKRAAREIVRRANRKSEGVRE